MYPNKARCPQLAAAEARALSAPQFASFNASVLDPLRAELGNAVGSGAPIPDGSTFSLLDCSLGHLCSDFPLPKALTPDLLMRLESYFNYRYQWRYSYPSSDDTGRLSIGTFMQELLRAVQDESKPFALFSGHDTTLFPLLIAFNQTEALWPAFASEITFEVLKDNAVRVLYDDKPLTLCGNNKGT